MRLVRVGPEQLIGGRPAGVVGLGVPLEVPGAGEPLAAAVDRDRESGYPEAHRTWEVRRSCRPTLSLLPAPGVR